METKLIANNKKAYHNYNIEDTIECGIVLVGSEVKSIRAGKINIKDSYAIIKNNEVMILGMHIASYDKGSYFNLDESRMRKLLLNKKQIAKLKAKIEQKGYTIIPTKVYFKGSLVKMELGIAKGKELHDKRDSLKTSQLKRELDRVVKQYRS